MSGSAPQRAAELARGLGRAGSPAEVLVGAQQVLQRVFDAEAVFVASADPDTWLLTGGESLNVPPEAMPRFLDNEYGERDVVKFRHLAAAPTLVDTLHDRTHGDLRASARWREVLEPLGWGDEMRAALRVSGRTWGFVCIHRAAGDAPYTEAEVRLLAALAPALGRELRRTSTDAMPARAGEPAATTQLGVLLLGVDGELIGQNDAAAEWLDELRTPGLRGVPVILQTLARSVRPGAGTTVHLPVVSGRWATLHASWVAGSSAGVSVVVGETRPDSVAPRLAMAVGLTPREQEVVAAVLRGQSTREIADQLFISEYTVQTHLRSVFAKTGVHSRRELVARAISGR